MKKIIQSSALALGICFFATTANAQLTSEQPSQAAKAVNKTVVATAPANVQTASSMAAVAPAAAKVVVVKEEVSTTSSAAASSAKAAIESQGVMPSATAPVEAKVATTTTAPDPKKAVIQQ
jgi:hypothetical protein